MIARRTFLAAGGAFALMPSRAQEASRLSFRGALQQGSLVIGRAAPGAKIAVDGTAVLVSPDGAFALGLAYDCAKPVHVAAQFADGSSEARDVTALTRQYEIQTINGLQPDLVSPSEEQLKRIAREKAMAAEARSRETEGVGFAEPFEWPVPGIVSGLYGSRRVLNGKPMAPHLGVDIAAPEGTPVHVAADGVVSICDEFLLGGGYTLIDHGHGVSTCYMHQSKRMVKAGDKVARGQVIGLVGHTGRATGPHAHWGLSWFQVSLDPSLSAATPLPSRS